MARSRETTVKNAIRVLQDACKNHKLSFLPASQLIAQPLVLLQTRGVYLIPCIQDESNPSRIVYQVRDGFSNDCACYDFDKLDEAIDYFYLVMEAGWHRAAIHSPGSDCDCE